MKRILSLVILTLTLWVISSCKEEIIVPSNSEQILGAWIFKGYDYQDANVTILQKEPGLDSSKYGYIFYKDSRL
ncbi:MAG TPA: hypothetical protein VMT35_18760, partial [Ignavibacteriaceae bacterium]|nr:hypothetical protein [Ignavibacteriaceae bacterium]